MLEIAFPKYMNYLYKLAINSHLINEKKFGQRYLLLKKNIQKIKSIEKYK